MNLIVFFVAFQAEAEKSMLTLQVRSRIEELEKRFLGPYMDEIQNMGYDIAWKY